MPVPTSCESTIVVQVQGSLPVQVTETPGPDMFGPSCAQVSPFVSRVQLAGMLSTIVPVVVTSAWNVWSVLNVYVPLTVRLLDRMVTPSLQPRPVIFPL